MDLAEYFENTKGMGILSTADGDGKVDSAVFSKPYIMEKDTVAFIMLDRLTHHNLLTNKHAAFLFKEDGPGYKGVRLFLTKEREDDDLELIKSMRRKKKAKDKDDEARTRFIVYFKVDKVLPLVGAGKEK